MAVFDVFPDAEAVTSTILRADLGARVYSEMPKRPAYPLILVRRYGGVPVTRMRLDAADVQIDVYGNTKKEAQNLAQQARAALLARGETGYAVTVTGADVPNAYVTGISQIQGVSWLPDTSNTPINRYVLSMRVFLHAA